MPMSRQSTSYSMLRARRIGVFGGTRLDPQSASFCRKLGETLAKEHDLVIVSGGFKHHCDYPERVSVDWSVVEGAARWLRRKGIALEDRIVTLIPDPDDPELVRFREGAGYPVRGGTKPARRFRVIGYADILVAVGGTPDHGGAAGTREMIDLAWALEKPVLPLPFTGGATKEVWAEEELRGTVQKWFDIDKDLSERWASLSLADLLDDEVTALAETTKRLLLHQLKRKCFVMMPFDREFDALYENAIEPAIEQSGLIPVRTDHLGLVGSVVDALRTGISTCTCALAVTTGDNANVMYELGLAHALGKPVVLVRERRDGRDLVDIPYDIAQESVIGYGKDMDELRTDVVAVLAQFRG